MTSGIYKLTFRSGKIYIGQSVDIETRWKQHADKFRKGTAAKAMQAEFNRSGFPDARILMVCHKDHLDMMESMYINSALIHDKSKVLNTSIPKDYSNEEIAVIEKNEDYLKYSIVQLIQQLSCAKANLANVQDELDTLHEEGIRVPDDHLEVEKLNDSLNLQVAKLIKVNQELSRRANMTWLERLFS